MNELRLLCTIGGRRTAIEAVRVQSVIEIDEITPIPRAPTFIRGLTALRSQALTVVDCASALGFDTTIDHADQRAVVVEIDGHLYALLVDEAFDVIETDGNIIALQGGFGANWQRVAQGMVETDFGPALLLEPEKLIAGPEARAA